MTRTASLGMYDFPWLRTETDALWAELRDRLRTAGIADVPDALDRARPLRAIWRDPNLLLAQTCGYPLMTEFAGRLQLVATPVYDFPGCDGPRHCSFVIVREDETAESLAGMRGRRCAINGRDSNSGMNLLRAMLAPLAEGRPFFASVLETGAHLESLRAVREGAADVAAIDCVTHGLAARYRPELLDGTRILARSMTTPSLPFVTSLDMRTIDRTALYSALAQVTATAVRATGLGMTGLAVLSLDEYAVVTRLEQIAIDAGYQVLC